MRSSTSSSELASPGRGRADDWSLLTPDSTTRVPGRGWGLAWVLALTLTVVGLACIELSYRHGGITGSVVDDRDLWSYQRSRVYGPPGQVVALLGSSQMQLGFSTERLRRDEPERRVVQLAVDGTHPYATLRDLAHDRDFRGIVIIDVSVWGLSAGARESQAAYVRHYHDTSTLDRRLNRAASAWLEQRLAVRAPGVDLLRVLRTRTLPEPFYVVTRADRSRRADYTLVDLAAHRADRIRRTRDAHAAAPVPPERWLAEARAVEPLVELIENRGGRVAFVVFPSSGESRDIFAATYPRDRYWDRFAATTRAITLHFLDVSALADLTCPDTIHLDQRDTDRFTGLLMHELRQRGLFAERVGSRPATTSR